MRRMRGLGAVLSMGVAACVVGCGPSPDLPARHARRFVPFNSEWIPESEVPKEPQKSPNMVVWELTETLEPPGPEEQRAAAAWVERCYDAARRHGWYEFAQGLADHYEKMTKDPNHYRNPEYMLDDRIMDPDHPEFLMYYRKPDGSQALAGMMFITRNLEERGPQFAGLLTVWHYHIWATAQCVEHEVIARDFATRDGRCLRGEPRHRSPEMLHTWLIDHPKGPFATSMMLSRKVVAAGLEKRMRERGF